MFGRMPLRGAGRDEKSPSKNKTVEYIGEKKQDNLELPAVPNGVTYTSLTQPINNHLFRIELGADH